ncbi:MAG: protein-tyrosine kinase [Butyrivibrio sp.]|nr:protein-tyrosine kinase [Butyrivibrio sp.]
MSENTNMHSNTDDVIEIDLFEVFGVLMRHIWAIIAFTLIFAIAGFAFSKFVLPEQFQSTTKIYILNKSDSVGSNVTLNDVQTSTQLTKDYAELITSRYVLETVMHNMNIADMKYEDFKDKITVDTPTDTRIVSITVTDTSPKLAQQIANNVREVAAAHITKVMDIDAVNIVEDANLPDEKSAPSCSRWAVVAGLIGFLLMAALVIIRYVLDDSIKTSEDVEKYLGLSTLALIPLDDGINKEKAEKKQEQERKKKHGKNQPEEKEKTVIRPEMAINLQEINKSDLEDMEIITDFEKEPARKKL